MEGLGVMCGGTAEEADRENLAAILDERYARELPREHADLSEREAAIARNMSRRELFANVGAGG